MTSLRAHLHALQLALKAQGTKPLVSTFQIKNAAGQIVQTKFRVQAVVGEELEDGSIELTFTGYPHGDEGDAELVPNALAAGPAVVTRVLAERDAARESALQIQSITVRIFDKKAPRRRPGRSGIPGRWTPFQRVHNFVAMQRLIDDGIAPGPTAASECLAKRPGDHHTILTAYKTHRALLAAGNAALLEHTIAAYSFSLRSRGLMAGTGYVEARTRITAMLSDYARNRRARQAAE